MCNRIQCTNSLLTLLENYVLFAEKVIVYFVYVLVLFACCYHEITISFELFSSYKFIYRKFYDANLCKLYAVLDNIIPILSLFVFCIYYEFTFHSTWSKHIQSHTTADRIGDRGEWELSTFPFQGNHIVFVWFSVVHGPCSTIHSFTFVFWAIGLNIKMQSMVYSSNDIWIEIQSIFFSTSQENYENSKKKSISQSPRGSSWTATYNPFDSKTLIASVLWRDHICFCFNRIQ